MGVVAYGLVGLHLLMVVLLVMLLPDFQAPCGIPQGSRDKPAEPPPFRREK
jgi:hypothetical protein